MKKEFVIRGQIALDSANNGQEKLNFSGHTPGYAYRLVEFQIYSSRNMGAQNFSAFANITAGKTALPASNADFNQEALIATATYQLPTTPSYPVTAQSIVNDTFLITQDLILSVYEENGEPVNFQCKFESVKVSKAEEAVTNYRQFTISDG